MPGMTGGLSPANPTLQAAFRTALVNQGELALLIFVTLAITWVACRELLPARARLQLYSRRAHGQGAAGPASTAAPASTSEPAGRRLLRLGFGILWIADAILQAQPQLPGGLPSRVIGPATAGSPGWVQHLVSWGAAGWSYHPVQDATAAIWIQLGIGAWLIATAGGRWSRLAGLAAAAWGLVVWVFGEAFGGLLAPGLTVLFGAPGAALVYAVGGGLIALPERLWRRARLGRVTLQVTGGCLLALALLQAWPGRGFWLGRVGGRPGPLAAMARSMAAVPQPALLAHLVRGFGSVAAAHGFAANLVVVLLLAGSGTGLLTGRRAFVRPAVVVAIAFFLADWVLVQDFGFFGGLGTDPNSMLPFTLLVASAYLAMRRVPATPADAPSSAVSAPVPFPDGQARHPWRVASRLRAAVTAIGTASASVVVTVWACAVMLLGAAPMAAAATSRTADPVIASALSGPAASLDSRAAAFSLTDQDGRQVSLASLRGKVVLLTFLDPVCTTDCPLIAQEFRAADQVLGGRASRVALVAIVASPVYRSVASTRAFDVSQRLTGVRNWFFLTGSLARLRQAWRDYHVTAQIAGAGSMVLHPDVAYVIDARGDIRAELTMDTVPGTASSQSSFAVLLAQAAERVMR